MNKLLKNREEEFSEDWNKAEAFGGFISEGNISFPLVENFQKQTNILIFKELIQKMEGDNVEIPEASTFDQFHNDNERRIYNQALQQQQDYLQGLITTLEI